MVRRVFVEKKEGFDVEAQSLFHELSENLHLRRLSGVRVVNRYDIEGIDLQVYESAKKTIFSEPAVDRIWDEEMKMTAGCRCFLTEYLPGQYDQRADSAAQCIQLINGGSKPVVRFAKMILLAGEISDEELETVKQYCINPVDSQEGVFEKPRRLTMDMTVPQNVDRVEGFCQMSPEELEACRKDMGFAMSQEDLQFVRIYFADQEHREPTVTELKVIDTYWSDHCRHTTFHTQITQVEFGEGCMGKLLRETYEEYLALRSYVYENRDKPICLMDLAVIGAKYLKKKGLAEDLDESEEINACSIKATAVVDGREEEWLVMFKNETHNHPTEIEPFGGAATCLGGAIRDPLSGRVYVYQAMRVTGSADPRAGFDETLAGKLPQRKITKSAASGYSSYGNQIGLATGQVAEIYHPDYVAKRMEVGAVIGAAPADHVVRERPAAGDVIILVGGRTGRDGCGGATGSSKGHTEDSILTCGAEVQKGNPPVERSIQRLFRRREAARLIKRCNDFGAGGVSVAIGELAESIDVNLDLVPKKYEGLDGTELAISESQERMAVVVSPQNAKRFMTYAAEENLEATIVAEVTDTHRFRMDWRGDRILDLSRQFLETNGAIQENRASMAGFSAVQPEELLNGGTLKEAVKGLQGLNCASQKGLVEQFDSTIGAGTVLMPLGGKYQLSPAAGMAAKLPVTTGETDTATLMTYGFDPELSEKSPFHGAYYAVVESVTKLGAMGGNIRNARLTFQEYFERLGTDETRWGKPLAALLGALKAQMFLEIPAIGGKDSMSGTFMDKDVPPTLISFGVNLCQASRVVSTELKSADSLLVLVSPGRTANGLLREEAYRRQMDRVYQLIQQGKIRAAAPIGMGGALAAAVKMAVGNQIGLELFGLTEEELSRKEYGGLLLELAAPEEMSPQEVLEELFPGVSFQLAGKTLAEPVLRVYLSSDKTEKKSDCVAEAPGRHGSTMNAQKTFDCASDAEKKPDYAIDLQELTRSWREPLESVFPSRVEVGAEKPQVFSYSHRERKHSDFSFASPRVFIPVFPGTNCEMDSQRAFEKAGGTCLVQVLNNLDSKGLEESIGQMAEQIRQSQIIMLPGGFSGGDEPDGSAKFITAVFRNPRISEAVEDLMENRDGLILGVCNGFQALIKLGLVPGGKIVSMKEDSPTLTYNTVNRHMSRLVRTRIASVKSPWLAGVSLGEIHTVPISHGEGRFIAAPQLAAELAKNGQIATQYVDEFGQPSMDMEVNPNGSLWAIEGITSPDGRIFGKMAHSERIGKNLYRNVPGETDQKIFASGIDYFK